jgi:hypothetical protein
MFALLKQSNFDIAMGEFLLDLSVGTAVMLVQPGDSVNPNVKISIKKPELCRFRLRKIFREMILIS